jgi:hypothetical protein
VLEKAFVLCVQMRAFSSDMRALVLLSKQLMFRVVAFQKPKLRR